MLLSVRLPVSLRQIAVVVLVGLSSLDVLATSCSQVAKSLEPSRMILNRPLYKPPTRGLESFAASFKPTSFEFMFGSEFMNFLHSLNSNHRWLDSGSGDRVAISQYHEKQKAHPGESAQTVALSLENPVRWSARRIQRFLKSKNHIDFHGRYFEEIPVDELGKFDLITEFFGPASYSSDLGLVLNRYLQLLKVGGRLYINNKFQTEIVIGDLVTTGLWDFLQQAQGISVRVSLNVIATKYSFEIIKTSEDAKFPSLSPISYEPGQPPRRQFQIVP